MDLRDQNAQHGDPSRAGGAPRTGGHVMLSMLAAAGAKYLFGNPGTTELPMMDALIDEPGLEYILGLQEIPVMSMADGYAQASGNVGFVNLHISCGLGNAMGMLYNAYREGTPLVVTAGQQDRRLSFEEPILGGDMVGVARPWTKWSAEIQRVEDLPSAIRRAVQTALTPPTGPVFLSIPVDVQAAPAVGLDESPPVPLDSRVRPPRAALRAAAELIARARNPAILAGSRVVEQGAERELVRLAERLGAPLLAEAGTTHGRLPFPADHPLSAVGLPLWSPDVLRRLDEFDLLLVVGMDVLRQYVYHDPPCPIPAHARIVHLDSDPWQLGKNYPEAASVLGHLSESAPALVEELGAVMSPDDVAQAAARRATREAAHRAARERLEARAVAERAVTPISPLGIMSTVARVIPPDVAVIEEAVTTTNTALERLGALKNTSGYFGHRGWALGWGLGLSIGVKLAWPERPVLAILGDGAALYGIQGLWTAAHYNIPVTFLICHNAQYEILKVGAQGMRLPHARAGRFVGMDITEPEIDYVKLAESLGVSAARVTTLDELEPRLRTALAANRPTLLEVPISRELPDGLKYG